MELITSLHSAWQTEVAENVLTDIPLKLTGKTSTAARRVFADWQSINHSTTVAQLISNMPAELRKPMRERTAELNALLDIFTPALLAEVKKESPENHDWSNTNKWSLKMIASLDQLVHILVLLLKVDSEFKAANILRQFSSVLAGSDKTKKAGENGLNGAIGSGIFGFALAGAGTYKTVKGTSIHMKKEAEIVKQKESLHLSVSENKTLIIEKNTAIKKLENANAQSGTQQRSLAKETKILTAENQEINAKLTVIEQDLIKARADGDITGVSKLMSERRELTAKLKANTEAITAKESEIKTLVQADAERNRQMEALVKEVQNLTASNDDQNVELEQLNHSLSAAQHKLQKTQSEGALLTQTQRPASGMIEAEAQRSATANNAQAKILEENSRVFQQTAATEDDYKRKTDALKEVIIRTIGEMMNANNSRINTTINLLTLRA